MSFSSLSIRGSKNPKASKTIEPTVVKIDTTVTKVVIAPKTLRNPVVTVPIAKANPLKAVAAAVATFGVASSLLLTPD